MTILTAKRYRAIVFFPGPLTLWRTGRRFDASEAGNVPLLRGERDPDPAEIIAERAFRTELFARAWACTRLKRLKNVRAEIHDTADE